MSIIQPYKAVLSAAGDTVDLVAPLALTDMDYSTNTIMFAMKNIGDKDISSFLLNLPTDDPLRFRLWKMTPPDSKSNMKFSSEVLNLSKSIKNNISFSGTNSWNPGDYIYLIAEYDGARTGNLAIISAVPGLLPIPSVTSAPTTTFPNVTFPNVTFPNVTFPGKKNPSTTTATTYPRTPDVTTTQPPENKSNHTVLIIGASIGLILAIIVGIYFYRRNKN